MSACVVFFLPLMKGDTDALKYDWVGAKVQVQNTVNDGG
jgi:hypothetical protein